MLLAAAAAILYASPARALDAVWPSDVNAASHHLKNLPVPVLAAEPLRVHDLAVGACNIAATGVDNPVFSCASPGSLFTPDAPLVFGGGGGTHLQLTLDGTTVGIAGGALQRLALTFTGPVTGTMAAGSGTMATALDLGAGGVSGTLQAAQAPAYTGAVTTSAGSLSTAFGAAAALGTLANAANASAVPSFVSPTGALQFWGSNAAGTALAWQTVPGASIYADGIATGATQLASVASASLAAGTVAYVNSVDDGFRLKTSTDTPDSITIVAASGKSGFNWVRMGIVSLRAQAVTAWYVDPVSGNDENDGVSSGTALKTNAEWNRRTNGIVVSNVALNWINDIPDADTLNINVNGGSHSLGFIRVNGSETVLSTQTVSSAQARSAASNLANEITTPGDLSSFVGDQIRVQGTVNYATITKAVGTGVARLSELFNDSGSQVASGGITASQIVEVVQTRKGPLNVNVNGAVNLFVQDVRFDGTGSVSIAGNSANNFAFFLRTVIGGTSTGSIQFGQGATLIGGFARSAMTIGSCHPIGTAFGAHVSFQAGFSGAAYYKVRSPVFQGSTADINVVVGVLHIDGDLGQFDLGSGLFGVNLSGSAASGESSTLTFNSGRHYGSGNSSTAHVWNIGVGNYVQYNAPQPPTMDAGLGVAFNGANFALGSLPLLSSSFGNAAIPLSGSVAAGFMSQSTAGLVTARAVDVSSADITNQLKAASFPVLTGPVTTPGGSLATSLNLGAGGVTGTLPAGSFPALTGPVTTTAGSVATSLNLGSGGITGALPLADLAQGGAASTNLLAWSGTAWAPTAAPTSLPPSGSAGGDLTGTYPNPTIAANAVTNAKAAQMGAGTIKGNNGGSPANPADLTSTQVTAMLNPFTSSLQGVAPSSGGGTSNFLRADGTWATPPGTGVPTARTLTMTAPMTCDSGSSCDWSANRTIATPVFVASGASHATGLVPDPGSSTGTTRYLREDATWQTVSGGAGTVTTVTGTAPIVITSTPTTTPNVTIQGAITTGGTSTSATSLGALAAGTFQQTVSGGVSTPSVFAGTAASVPYYTTGGQLAQDNASFSYDGTNHALNLGGGSASHPSLSIGTSSYGLYRRSTGNQAPAIVSVFSLTAALFDTAATTNGGSANLGVWVTPDAIGMGAIGFGGFGAYDYVAAGTHIPYNMTMAAYYDVALGESSALGTTDTYGFTQPFRTTPGVPTGVPAKVETAHMAATIDSSHDRLYIYDGAWMPFGQSTTGLATGPLCNTTTTGVWSACTQGTGISFSGTTITNSVAGKVWTDSTDAANNAADYLYNKLTSYTGSLSFSPYGTNDSQVTIDVVPGLAPFRMIFAIGGPDSSVTLPNAGTSPSPDFWLRPMTYAISGVVPGFETYQQVWEFDAAGGAYTHADLNVYVYQCGITVAAGPADSMIFEITKNGSRTGINVTVPCPNTVTLNTNYSATGSLSALASTDRIGVEAYDTSASYSTGALRATVTAVLRP